MCWFFLWFSPDSDGSESGWWIISIWRLVSRVHCPNLVLFYFILGVFSHPKSPIGRNRESGSLSVYSPVYPFSFSALLPRILWCWVSFARAFLLGRLLVRLKESRYFPDRGIDRSTDHELTQAARPAPGKIARGATQLRGFDPGPAAGPGGGRRAGRVHFVWRVGSRK